MKIVTIIGARPQFVKAAAVSRALKNYKAIKEIIIHTGQHFDDNMSKVFFDELEIPTPNYFLDINGGGHGAMTGRMLEKIEQVLQIELPDAVLVYGDTNSTLAGALAAKKLHINVIHVEAGLRSFNMHMPEEINRILTDRISDLLFCPTKTAVKNLVNEGFNTFSSKIMLTGDVMQDAALYYSQKHKKPTNTLLKGINANYVLATIHRAENTDCPDKLTNIIEALNDINKHIDVVLPMHPRTKFILKEIGLTPQFKTIDPLGYLDMINLISNSKLILTDSGGLQKEAFFFKKNCVTLREETEWVELVENGMNVLAGSNKDLIVSSAHDLLNRNSNFDINLYGNGKASALIASEILNFCEK